MEVFQPTNPNSLPWSLGCSVTGTCFLPSSPLSPSPLLTELQVHRLGWPCAVLGKRLFLGLCMFCSLFLKHTTPTLSLPKSKLSPKAPLQCHILREALLRARWDQIFLYILITSRTCLPWNIPRLVVIFP